MFIRCFVDVNFGCLGLCVCYCLWSSGVLLIDLWYIFLGFVVSLMVFLGVSRFVVFWVLMVFQGFLLEKLSRVC